MTTEFTNAYFGVQSCITGTALIARFPSSFVANHKTHPIYNVTTMHQPVGCVRLPSVVEGMGKRLIIQAIKHQVNNEDVCKMEMHQLTAPLPV